MFYRNPLAAEARRRVAVAAVRAAAGPHDALVDGGLDAVVLLDVDFGERVGLEGGRVADVAHGGGVDDVADDEALDGLVLGDGLAGGRAAHAVDVAAALLVAAVRPALDGHLCGSLELTLFAT